MPNNMVTFLLSNLKLNISISLHEIIDESISKFLINNFTKNK